MQVPVGLAVPGEVGQCPGLAQHLVDGGHGVVAVTARVLLGSLLAVGGLVLVIGPGALRPVDPVGLVPAFAAATGCAASFVIAVRPARGLPPVALDAAA